MCQASHSASALRAGHLAGRAASRTPPRFPSTLPADQHKRPAVGRPDAVADTPARSRCLDSMRSDPQLVATDGKGLACFGGLTRLSICDRLPPVATTGLHKGSIVSGLLGLQ